ncbi:hypothetical protein BC830DRAFT_706066 [Chytriomyces sp. MP71]|nr:hypothetical protein BC830DRAFT_706066 [Chytriomyces sp. MP71]
MMAILCANMIMLQSPETPRVSRRVPPPPYAPPIGPVTRSYSVPGTRRAGETGDISNARTERRVRQGDGEGHQARTMEASVCDGSDGSDGEYPLLLPPSKSAAASRIRRAARSRSQPDATLKPSRSEKTHQTPDLLPPPTAMSRDDRRPMSSAAASVLEQLQSPIQHEQRRVWVREQLSEFTVFTNGFPLQLELNVPQSTPVRSQSLSAWFIGRQ